MIAHQLKINRYLKRIFLPALLLKRAWVCTGKLNPSATTLGTNMIVSDWTDPALYDNLRAE